jgi:hypothetical protein
MPVANVTMIDETTSGERAEALTLEFLTERVTVRELIRSRIYQEVTEHNARTNLVRSVLFRRAPVEEKLNGPERKVDWEAQFEKALQAFEGNGFLLFAGDRQLIELDEEIELRHDTEVTFLRLVPLVGG